MEEQIEILKIINERFPNKKYKNHLLAFIRENGGFEKSASKVASWTSCVPAPEIEDIFIKYLLS